MSDHHGTTNPIHGGGEKSEKFVSTLSAEERIGLTSEEAEKRVIQYLCIFNC